MPRLGYPEMLDYGEIVGWAGAGGSFWIKQAAARHAGATFDKERVGLCEVAFRADDRAQVDALARDVAGVRGTVLTLPRAYPELELVHIPG